MSWHVMRTSVLVSIVLVCAAASAGESRFAETHSRNDYVHWIDLYDANNRNIDPTAPDAPPYSPLNTCGRCHDYQAIAHGYHFQGPQGQANAGRLGEPWIWTDPRTGTQIPLSYRGWPGTYHPVGLKIADWDFVLKFGRHLPGGGPGEARETPEEKSPAAPPAKAAKEDSSQADDAGRWRLSGRLNVDCMICHSHGRTYSAEIWWQQIENQNFAWAPTAALGLGYVEGKVSGLPDDFDPAKADPNSRERLPKTTYASLRMNAEKKVFFDIVRKPHDDACYYCHSTRWVGAGTSPEWTHDQDVHLQAGMSCCDCHRNGLEHQTVRGFEGEQHPTGQSVATLSCRGCHLNAAGQGGRLGAPQPLHKGRPPLHLEKLSCTACHSGPRLGPRAFQVQTSLAHGLGLPSHDYTADMAPGIVAPVLMREGEMLYPHRATWPAFWGAIQDNQVTPLNPEAAYDALRSTLRVRRGEAFREAVSQVRLKAEDKAAVLGADRAKVAESDLTEPEKAKLTELEQTQAIEGWREKLAQALTALKKAIREPGAEPVYISGGKAFRLAQDGSVEEFQHAAAKPYAWKLAHDVRPARWSSGVTGCVECHSVGAPILESKVTALGPAPDKPTTQAMYELAGYDKTKMDAWSLSFQGRTAFKWLGFSAMGVVALVLLSGLVTGVQGLFGLARRKR